MERLLFVLTLTIRLFINVAGYSYVDVPYMDCENNLCFGYKRGQTSCIHKRNCKALTIVYGAEADLSLMLDRRVVFAVYLMDVEPKSPMYVSLGLSEDELMGDDVSVDCVKPENDTVFARNSIVLENSWDSRVGVANTTYVVDGVNVNAEESIYSEIDMVFSCKWIRNITSSITMEQDEENEVFEKVVNLASRSYHIRLAHGYLNSMGDLLPNSKLNQAVSPSVRLDFMYKRCQNETRFTDYFCMGVRLSGEKSAKYSNCVDSSTCDILVVIVHKEPNIVFHVFSNNVSLLRGTDNRGFYIAVGLSRDGDMGKDSITECLYTKQHEVQVQDSYNRAIEDNIVDSAYISSSQHKMYVTGPLMHCTWIREPQVEYAEASFNLIDNGFHVAIALGYLQGDTSEKQKHNKVEITPQTILFPPFRDWFGFNRCILKNARCFGMRNSLDTSGRCLSEKNCRVTVIITAQRNFYTITLRGYVGETYWIAVGLSMDDLMGEDVTFECSPHHQQIGWNTDAKENVLTNISHGLLKKRFTYSEGVLECWFKLNYEFSVSMNKGSKYNLRNEAYVVLLAFGAIAGEGEDSIMLKHQEAAMLGTLAVLAYPVESNSSGLFVRSDDQSEFQNFIPFLAFILTFVLFFIGFSVALVYGPRSMDNEDDTKHQNAKNNAQHAQSDQTNMLNVNIPKRWPSEKVDAATVDEPQGAERLDDVKKTNDK